MQAVVLHLSHPYLRTPKNYPTYLYCSIASACGGAYGSTSGLDKMVRDDDRSVSSAPNRVRLSS